MTASTLITGATGYVGGRLLARLRERGEEVGAVVRDPDRAALPPGGEVHRADMLDADSLAAIGDSYRVAYYLVHSMGRGNEGDYAERDARAARNFARFARSAGIEHVVYLGGLGHAPGSEHLRSRQRVGEIRDRFETRRHRFHARRRQGEPVAEGGTRLTGGKVRFVGGEDLGQMRSQR